MSIVKSLTQIKVQSFVFFRKLRVDYKTGEDFELGRLAPLTYKKIMDETKAIQTKMRNAFKLGDPKDQPVAIRYEGDEKTQDSDSKNLRIVEMEKPRPQFFSPNLMQKAQPKSDSSSSTTVRPSGLG